MSGSGSGQTPSQRRLQKELMSMISEPPSGMRVDTEAMGNELNVWLVRLQGCEGTLFEGENFILQFKFGPKYPFDSPEVTFTGENIPLHPHVYSNGHIYLSILTDDWDIVTRSFSPSGVFVNYIHAKQLQRKDSFSYCAFTLCLQKHPPDNEFYVKTCSKNPKKTKWWYHDDSV